MKLIVHTMITLLLINFNCHASNEQETITSQCITSKGNKVTIFSDETALVEFPQTSKVITLPNKIKILLPEQNDRIVCIEKPGEQVSFYNFHQNSGNPIAYFLGSHKYQLLQQKICDEEKSARIIEQRQKFPRMITRFMKRQRTEDDNN